MGDQIIQISNKMKIKSAPNIYKQAQRFADITKSLIISGNIKRAKYCLQKAEDIFNTGSTEVRNVISNVYLFSVSSFIEIHHCKIKNLFPDVLQSEYNKQVNLS